jgi:hypothetical protein
VRNYFIIYFYINVIHKFRLIFPIICNIADSYFDGALICFSWIIGTGKHFIWFYFSRNHFLILYVKLLIQSLESWVPSRTPPLHILVLLSIVRILAITLRPKNGLILWHSCSITSPSFAVNLLDVGTIRIITLATLRFASRRDMANRDLSKKSLIPCTWFRFACVLPI